MAAGIPPMSGTSTVFIDSNLDTHFAMNVSDTDTVGDLKRKIIIVHSTCFPDKGKIDIHAMKVRRSTHFYHLSDSMLVKSAFLNFRKAWFLYMDAASISLVESQEGYTKDGCRPEICGQVDLPRNGPSKLLSNSSPVKDPVQHDTGTLVCGRHDTSLSNNFVSYRQLVPDENKLPPADEVDVPRNDSEKTAGLDVDEKNLRVVENDRSKRTRDGHSDDGPSDMSRPESVARKKRKKGTGKEASHTGSMEDILKENAENLAGIRADQKVSEKSAIEGCQTDATTINDISETPSVADSVQNRVVEKRKKRTEFLHLQNELISECQTNTRNRTTKANMEDTKCKFEHSDAELSAAVTVTQMNSCKDVDYSIAGLENVNADSTEALAVLSEQEPIHGSRKTEALFSASESLYRLHCDGNSVLAGTISRAASNLFVNEGGDAVSRCTHEMKDDIIEADHGNAKRMRKHHSTDERKLVPSSAEETTTKGIVSVIKNTEHVDDAFVGDDHTGKDKESVLKENHSQDEQCNDSKKIPELPSLITENVDHVEKRTKLKSKRRHNRNSATLGHKHTDQYLNGEKVFKNRNVLGKDKEEDKRLMESEDRGTTYNTEQMGTNEAHNIREGPAEKLVEDSTNEVNLEHNVERGKRNGSHASAGGLYELPLEKIDNNHAKKAGAEDKYKNSKQEIKKIEIHSASMLEAGKNFDAHQSGETKKVGRRTEKRLREGKSKPERHALISDLEVGKSNEIEYHVPSLDSASKSGKINFLEAFTTKEGQHESSELGEYLDAKETTAEKRHKMKKGKKMKKLDEQCKSASPCEKLNKPENQKDLESQEINAEKSSRRHNKKTDKHDEHYRSTIPVEVSNKSHYQTDKTALTASEKNSGSMVDEALLKRKAYLKENVASLAPQTDGVKDLADAKYAKKGRRGQSKTDRYRVAVRRPAKKNLGGFLNNSSENKNSSAYRGAIFQTSSRESSQDGEENSSDANALGVSDESSASGSEEDAVQSTPQSGSKYNKNSRIASEGEHALSQSAKTPLGIILRGSNGYRNAKITASQSVLEESGRQPVDFDVEGLVSLSQP